MKKLLIISLVLGLCCASCATKKEIIYFQDAEALTGTRIAKAYEPLVEPNDILYITLSALEDDLLKPFRRNITTDINGGGDATLKGYLVNIHGDVHYPGLGAIAVAGKTRLEIVQILKQALKDYISAEVVVDVRITNFKVTVLGAVSKPGVFTVINERITLPEVLALAGDLTENGNRNNLTIIREADGKREVKKIDLTQTDFFASSYYFLKQNDVVYVAPSLKGVKRSGFIPDVPAILSLATIVLTAIIILNR